MIQDDTPSRGRGAGVGWALLSGALFPALAFLATSLFSVDPLINKLGLVKREDLETALAELKREAQEARSEVPLSSAQPQGSVASVTLIAAPDSQADVAPRAAVVEGLYNFHEEPPTSGEEVLVTVPVNRRSIIIVTAYATGLGTGRWGRPSSLSVEVRINGFLCTKSRDAVEKRTTDGFYASATCMKELNPKDQAYEIRALRESEELTEGQTFLSYVLLERTTE